MKKLLSVLSILMLASLLLALTGCSSTGTGTITSPAPTSTPSTPTQTTGVSSLGSPALPSVSSPQGTAPAGSIVVVPPQTAVVPPVSIPNIAVPSQGASVPNAAIPAYGNYYYNPPFSSQPQNTGIWVTGQGQVTVTPDVANLTLGVDSQASTVAEAQNNAAKAMNAVIQVLKDKGVASEDIATVSFSINQTMDYKTNTVTGYQVSNTVAVKVRRIANTGLIIDAATSTGGNLIRISGIYFTVNDPEPFLKQAREKAMADAHSKASQLASLGQVTLGPPTYISESTGSYSSVPAYYNTAAPMASPITSINPGQTQISVIVQIVYSIQ